MDSDCRDIRIPLRELGRVHHVGEFTLAVAQPAAQDGYVLRRPQLRKHDAAGRGHAEALGCEEDDARVAVGGGGAVEGGEEGLDEEGVRELVGAELVLVAVLGGAGGDGHDAGVADEDV